MSSQPYQILLTNDDGIGSPGLLAAAEALSDTGRSHRSRPARAANQQRTQLLPQFRRHHRRTTLTLANGRQIKGYAVGATPAQVVIHALYEILPTKPDLAVSGINLGENAGNCVTISGTMGAAFETASAGIPTLAASLQLPPRPPIITTTIRTWIFRPPVILRPSLAATCWSKGCRTAWTSSSWKCPSPPPPRPPGRSPAIHVCAVLK